MVPGPQYGKQKALGNRCLFIVNYGKIILKKGDLKMENKSYISEEGFCQCNGSHGVHSEIDNYGYWLVCDACNKSIEDSYEYFNHFDGEDHTLE